MRRRLLELFQGDEAETEPVPRSIDPGVVTVLADELGELSDRDGIELAVVGPAGDVELPEGRIVPGLVLGTALGDRRRGDRQQDYE